MLEEAILIGLAGWRIASLLVTEDGPYDIFRRIRFLFQPIGIVDPRQGFFDGLFSCMWCMSVWTTLLMYGLYALEPRAVIVIAAMAIALIPEALHGGRQHPN